jgi:hypothetical protein
VGPPRYVGSVRQEGSVIEQRGWKGKRESVGVLIAPKRPGAKTRALPDQTTESDGFPGHDFTGKGGTMWTGCTKIYQGFALGDVFVSLVDENGKPSHWYK